MKKRCMAFFLSAVLTVLTVFSGVEPVSASNEKENESEPVAVYESTPTSEESIVENVVLFSVISNCKSRREIVYLRNGCALANDFGLFNLERLYVSKLEEGGYQTFYRANFSDGDVAEMVERLSADERIASAEPDYIWESAIEGSYAEVTAEEFEAETHFPCLDVNNVWGDLYNSGIQAPGYGTVVAVIDTGVDYTHVDLRDSMWINAGEIPDNGIDDDNNGYVDDIYGYNFIANNGDPMDDMGHGTHVAGIIAMSPGNGGGVGLAYGTKIMAIKAGQANGNFASSDIAKAIDYAMINGADVINMSFGGSGKSYLVEQVLKDAFGDTVLVAAAGNDGKPTTDAQAYGYLPNETIDIYPGGYSYVLGVMASNNDGSKASFSNWDFIIGKNCEYEMAAPGVEVYSTLPSNRYAYWSGTSMATPNVAAAAAILRGKYTDKSKYNSRYIMGQLVSATQSMTIPFADKVGFVHQYPLLNVRDSMLYQPKPRIIIGNIYMFDDPSISTVNNGDGIAQPGETINLGVSAFNYWGIATDVTIQIDALSIAGIENPYVELVKDNVTINDIGTFATENNGYTYTDGMLTGVSKPLKIKIKEDAPNDAQIQINFTMTAKNGIDDSDLTVYYPELPSSYTIIVQNGYPISGVIHEDMTLTADKYWIIQNNLLIPKGVTVTVEPGTQIQFWSADPTNPYADQQDVFIQVEGRFIAEGTEDNPIQIFPGKGYEDRSVIFTGNGILDDDFSNSYSSLTYVNLINFCFRGDYQYKNLCITNLDHCTLINNIYALDKWFDISLGFKQAYKTIFYNYCGSQHGYTNNLTFESIDCCSFTCNGDLYAGYFSNIDNSVFLQTVNHTFDSKPNPYLFEISSKEQLYNNAFLSQINMLPPNKIRIISAGNGHKKIDISGNFWGTTNPDLVKIQCYDADWNISLNELVQEPFLTLDDDMSAIYPFVTEAYVTDFDGNRLESVVGAQTIQVHVKFNRDMASDIQPMVSFGGAEPYTDYVLNGDWVSAREWVSQYTLEPFINLGRMYLRIKGAVAADDRWLVTGEDAARFFFEVTSSSAQSMSLQGEGLAGKNSLSWMQDDYETLAGYNLYRATGYDSSVRPEEQGFVKINRSIINDAVLTYVDEEVDPCVDYYYYFTVVDTDFHESKASNVVKCTPTESVPPVIVHTPVTTLVPGSAITISAEATDNVAVQGVLLHYRKAGESTWTEATMRKVSGDTYRATISAYEVTGEDMEYYVTATDGTNVGSCGTAAEPFVMKEDKGNLVGTVTISGRPAYGERLIAEVTGSNNTGTFSYQWKRSGADISSANAETYLLGAADIGHVISCVITSTVQEGSIEAETETAVDKADGPAAPEGLSAHTPSVKGASDGCISGTADGMEYSADYDFSIDENVFYIDGAEVTGLKAGYYYIRYAETDTTKAGEATLVEIPEGPAVLKGTVTISGSLKCKSTLTAIVRGSNNTGTLKYQWMRGKEPISGAMNRYYRLTAEDVGQLISCEVTSTEEGGSIRGLTSSAIEKANGPEAPDGLDVTAVSVQGASDGIISGTSKRMEYSIDDEFSDPAHVFAVEGFEITGLKAGIYYVRYVETETTKASEASIYVIKDGPEALVGAVLINGTPKCGELLFISVNECNNSGVLKYQWKRGGVAISGATGRFFRLSKKDIGQVISCEVTCSIEAGSIMGTTSMAVEKADGPEAPVGLKAKAVSVWGASDGVIAETEAGMEYSTDEDFGIAEHIVQISDTSVTGLVAGKYYIRYAETDTTKAGEIAEIIVPEGTRVVDSSAPQLLGANATGLTVTVEWKANAGVDQYAVFRKVTGGKWIKIAETSDTSHVDDSIVTAQTYYYTVRGVNARGKYITSYDTGGIGVTVGNQELEPLDKNSPVLTDAVADEGGIKISWIANSGVSRYAIFRKTANAKWTKLSEVTGTADGMKADAGSSCSWVDSTAEPDTTYIYTVRGMSEDGKYITNYDNAGISACLSGSQQAEEILDKSSPVLTGAVADENGIVISWIANSGVDKYMIFRKTEGGKWTKIVETTGTPDGNKASAGTTCSGFDTTAEAGITYIYTVRGMDSSGKYVTSYNAEGLSILIN